MILSPLGDSNVLGNTCSFLLVNYIITNQINLFLKFP